MNRIAPYAKALIAALVAGLGSLYQALDGADQNVTTQEWVAVAMTTLAGLVAVFAVPNRDPQAVHQDESVMPPERGEGLIGLLVAVLVVVILVVILLRLV